MADPLLLPSALLSLPCTVQTPLYMQPQPQRRLYHQQQQQQQHQPHPGRGGRPSPPPPPAAGAATTNTTIVSSSPPAAASGKETSGMILEIRQLYIPPSLSSTITSSDNGSKKNEASAAAASSSSSLYAFVRWKDTDHRQSGWYPLSAVSLKDPSAVLSLLSTFDPAGTASTQLPQEASGSGREGGAMPAAVLLQRPLLSTIYREVTPGMARTLRAKKPLHFLEERLLRDDATPTTVRYFVYLNQYIFSPWYYAPYGILQPEYDPLLPLSRTSTTTTATTSTTSGGEDVINPYLRDAHLCPFSLRLYSTPQQLQHEVRYHRKGRLRPPGAEVYRDEGRGLSVFEVNGSRYKTFCRHLFLLGKSFLENKLAGHDVHNYFFFVVCLHQRYFPQFVDDPNAMAVAGYFSWEKNSEHNLACIVTLPCFAGSQQQQQVQQKVEGSSSAPPPAAVPLHIGRFMIAFSYALSRQRGQVGGPERPLSDLGEAAYKRHWAAVLVRWMYTQARALQGQERPRREQRKRRRLDLTEEEEVEELELLEEEEEEEEEEETQLLYEAADDGGVEVSTTIRDIARAVRLEEPDVLKALLAMGVLHRNAEDRSTRLLLPPAYLEREAVRLAGQQRSLAYAIFSPACWHEACSRQVLGPGPGAAGGK